MTLPEVLEGRYRVIKMLPGGGQATVLLVEDVGGVRYVVKLYADAAFAAKAEVLERVYRAAPEHVVELIEHGYSDGCYYEVQAYLARGSLADLMDREGPRLAEARVREILIELTEVLAHIHALSIDHNDLKPGNVLVQADAPLDLVLADFGIVADTDGSVRAPKFLGATFAYTPPEAFAQVSEVDGDGAVKRRSVLHTTKWDWWSLGMIMVELLAGRHPFQSCNNMTIVNLLATRNSDELVTGVTDPAWCRLCRGLLRRDPQQRWGKDEINRWLANPHDPSLVVVEEQTPTSGGIRFLGRTYQTKPALAAALADNWEEAADWWRGGAQKLMDWLRHELGDRETAAELARIDLLTFDAQLLHVIHALDPAAPFTFRGIPLTGVELAKLADRAPTDEHAGALLRTLYEDQIVQQAAKQGAPLMGIDQRWRKVVEEYKQLRRRVGSEVSTPPPSLARDSARLTLLLAAATPGNRVIEGLRDRAFQASTADAHACAWFRELGSPESADVAALLLMPLFAAAAEQDTRAGRERERTARQARREAALKQWSLIGLIVLISGVMAYVLLPYDVRVTQDRLADGSPGPQMVFIRGGTFTMGSPAGESGRRDNERQHRVSVADFYLAKHAVTVGEFRRFVEDTGYRTEAERNVGESGCYAWSETQAGGEWWAWREGRNWRNPGFNQSDDHPVVCVSWNDAVAYIDWLNRESGQTYRLPTEAEWEYAARAGTTTARYWGNNPNQACRYANGADQTRSPNRNIRWTSRHECNDGYFFTAPVGRFQPNPWGLYDMLGNVWEWTCSVFDADYGGAEQRCADANESGFRVVRGGSWYNYPLRLRSAYRSWLAPDDRIYGQGFRISRSL